MSGAAAGSAAQRDAILRWALIGALACAALVTIDVARTGTNPLNLIQPGVQGPSTALIAEDFPGGPQLGTVGLDGQQFYAMATDPFDPAANAEHLDRPRYRWQRALLPWLAGALHPGDGVGLIWALAGVTFAALVLGAVATGYLAVGLRGPAWAAAIFPLLPGSYWSLRASVADALALALGVAALALAQRRRTRSAMALGAAAVLAKESTVLLLGGWFLHRRDRSSLLAAVVPAAVGAAWFLALRRILPDGEVGVNELALPFTGWWHALTDRWLDGRELIGMASSVAALVAGLAALGRRGLRHPLGPAIAVQLAFTTVCNANVLGQDFGGTRSTMTLLLLGLVTFVSPGPASDADAPAEPVSRRPAAPA